MDDTTQERSHTAAFLRAAGAITALYGALVGLFLLSLPAAETSNGSDTCSGIGWGCTLSPRDSALMVGYFAGIPVLIGTPLAFLTAWLLTKQRRHQSGRVALGSVLTGCTAGAVLVALLWRINADGML